MLMNESEENGFDLSLRPLLTDGQVEVIPERLLDILGHLGKVYDRDSEDQQQDAVLSGQEMLGGLLKDLGVVSDTKLEINKDWVFSDVVTYARRSISGIAESPVLTHQQKVKLLTGYPDILLRSRFTLTMGGGQAQVQDTLTTIKDINPDTKEELKNIFSEVKASWREARHQ